MSGQKNKALTTLKTLFVDKKESKPSETPETPNNYLNSLPVNVRDGPLKAALNVNTFSFVFSCLSFFPLLFSFSFHVYACMGSHRSA